MKSITFRPCGSDFVTHVIDGLYSDCGVKLSVLAAQGYLFRMLLISDYFRVVIDGRLFYGYTDKYGNKIFRYNESFPGRVYIMSRCRKRNK